MYDMSSLMYVIQSLICGMPCLYMSAKLNVTCQF